jgi:hypothetical protein
VGNKLIGFSFGAFVNSIHASNIMRKAREGPARLSLDMSLIARIPTQGPGAKTS